MNKPFQAITNGQSLSELVDKLAAKWGLRTQHTTRLMMPTETPEDILRDLIAIPTTSNNSEALHDALDYIEQFLVGVGMHVKRLQWDGVESLVATTRPTKTPSVYLAGHIDVVPADPSMFELRREDGKYFGRGVVDMKGGIAAYLSVIKTLPQPLSNYDFGVMIMTDEEIGGVGGAANLAREGYLAQLMVLPDGGGPNWNRLERYAKSIWHVTLEADGQSAHGSRPWEGRNAIDTIVTALQEIKALFSEMGPDTSTINTGIIQGGEAINQIPGSASVSLDMRFISDEDRLRIVDGVQQVIKRHHLSLAVETVGNSMTNNPDNPYLKAYAECTAAVVGEPVTWVTSNAANDGRYFSPLGVECAVAYPVGGNHHGNGEWMSVKSYEDFQQIIRTYLDTVARQ